jgi:protoheme IX farnesyltransferase
VIFLWTPPHFWALAMKFRKDYAAANVPMLPVVAPAAEVTRKILWYSYAMVAATLALVPYAGWIYGTAALGLGGWFLAAAHRLHAQVRADASVRALPGSSSVVVVTPSERPLPMRLFHLSIAYLTLLFAAVAVTALLPWGHW